MRTVVANRVPAACCLAAVTALLVLSPNRLWASAKDAARQVRQGIQRHRAGDYEAAAEAFAEAAEALPDNPQVQFDQACALAAQGKADEAVDLFRKAALARDPTLVASCHYNLGCVAAAKAKSLFGDKPEEATVETREQGLPLIAQAVSHYRDCLRIDTNHAAARHNLEVLRLWLKHMQDLWAQRDRQRRREETDLLQFLQWMQQEQRLLRAAVKSLGQEQDSPRSRQAVTKASQAQRLLAEETEPLREKIKTALEPPQPPAPPAAGSAKPADADGGWEKAIEVLTKLAIRVRSSMFRAADELGAGSLPETITEQTQAIHDLNEIYRAVAPFEVILEKAIATEEGLVEVSRSQIEPADADGANDESLIDAEPVAEDQSFVATWSEALRFKAQQAIQQLETAAAAVASKPEDDQGPSKPEQDEQTRQALKPSYEKAIELSPRIRDLADQAAGDVQRRKWKAALPGQEEALKLLEEIADSLPKQPPQEGDKQQNQEQQGDKNDQQDKQDSSQEQDSEKDSSEKDKQKSQRDRRRELSRQEAEALLSKVRQREREHQQRQKQLQRLLGAGVKVDKDW